MKLLGIASNQGSIEVGWGGGEDSDKSRYSKPLLALEHINFLNTNGWLPLKVKHFGAHP